MTDETDDERMRRLMKDQYVRPLPKRFYKTVEISADNEVLLDGRPVKTPMKAALRLQNEKVAEAVAEEWRAQITVINPGLMPMTRLANAAIDRTGLHRETIVDEIVSYANADLVCYRADRPPDLVRTQSHQWDPVIAWAQHRLDAIFVSTVGVTHHDQPEASRTAVRLAANAQGDALLTATYNLVTLLGSTLIPLMHLDGSLSAVGAWDAAHVDEDYQISQWGLDTEAERKREARRIEFDTFVKFVEMIRS